MNADASKQEDKGHLCFIQYTVPGNSPAEVGNGAMRQLR